MLRTKVGEKCSKNANPVLIKHHSPSKQLKKTKNGQIKSDFHHFLSKCAKFSKHW